ncbi:unnamed protein product, partial [Ilex paraguariensis]
MKKLARVVDSADPNLTTGVSRAEKGPEAKVNGIEEPSAEEETTETTGVSRAEKGPEAKVDGIEEPSAEEETNEASGGR